jgi:hypothetical protein
MYARFAPSALGVFEKWLRDTEGRMKEGISKNQFQILVEDGRGIQGMCHELIETANSACQEAELLGESTEAKEARRIVAETQTQFEALQSKIVFFSEDC